MSVLSDRTREAGIVLAVCLFDYLAHLQVSYVSYRETTEER